MKNAQQAYDRAQTLLQAPAPARRRRSRTPRPRCAPRRRGSIRRRHGSRAARFSARSPGRCSRSISASAKWCRPAGRCSRCCRRAISRCASSSAKPCCRSSSSAIAVDVQLRRLRRWHHRPRSASSSRTAEFTPPVIYSLEERAKLVFLIEARPRNAGAPARRPAGQRHACGAGAAAVTTAPDIAIDVAGPDQILRRPHGRARPVDAGQARHDLRLSRAERLRQDHDHPHADRPAHAGRRATAPVSATTSAPQADEIKRHVGYMTQRFSLYQDLSVRENLEFVARLYGTRAIRRRPRARWSSGSACAAARSSLPASCRAAGSSGSRSAPARCRTRSFCCSTSRPPASIPKARREFWNEIHALAARRADRAGLDPLHGRGRALPRDRLYRLWRAAGARHASRR